VSLPSETIPKRDPSLHSDQRWALVERVAESQHLKSSARLCQFLFYVAECAIRQAPEEATEQQIGIRVFGRPPGYNSSEDSIVRTHARLLRQKLEAYFAQEGLTEETIIEVPKGHYLPVFRQRNSGATMAGGSAVRAPEGVLKAATGSRILLQGSKSPGRLLAWMLIPILLFAAILFWRPWNRSLAPLSAVDTFWRPFLTGESPVVIYSNALFTGDSTNGLRYATPETSTEAQQGQYVDTYTGIGELASVYTLTRLFDAHKETFILKRSRLVTWDEAELRNLIFLGSRAENPSLRALPSTVDFTMVAQADSAGVVNHNPKPGEPAVFSRPEHPLTSDYAILALLPGVQPGKYILIFSGLTTFGTQAAVEYVSRPESAAELISKIKGPKGEIRPFEAVLQTSIVGGVPLQIHLVAIRVH
jgi:hypothetical protein